MPGDPFYQSPAWKAARLTCLVRARFRCRMCGASLRGKGNAHVDHIESRRKRPDLSLEQDNLQALCSFHHNSVKQAMEARCVPVVNGQGYPPDWQD